MRDYATIILNWNGAADTIACLDSLAETSQGGLKIVVDNGSVDDSVERLKAHLKLRFGSCRVIRDADIDLEPTVPPHGAVLVSSAENRGFAGGMNLGLQCANRLGKPCTVFLNNDTVVAPGSLDLIAARVLSDRDCFVALPVVTYLGTDRIWSCGGRVSRLGFRTYFHQGKDKAAVALPKVFRCTFFTGCCFAIRTADFAGRGGFTPRFFFGEEDMELCLWMKQHGKRALCLSDAVVQHRVSSSFARAGARAPASRAFIYYLNRFVHMRARFGSAGWYAWCTVYLPYVALLLLRRRIVTVRTLPPFLLRLLSLARRLDRVDRETFETCMRGTEWER